MVATAAAIRRAEHRFLNTKEDEQGHCEKDKTHPNGNSDQRIVSFQSP